MRMGRFCIATALPGRVRFRVTSSSSTQATRRPLASRSIAIQRQTKALMPKSTPAIRVSKVKVRGPQMIDSPGRGARSSGQARQVGLAAKAFEDRVREAAAAGRASRAPTRRAETRPCIAITSSMATKPCNACFGPAAAVFPQRAGSCSRASGCTWRSHPRWHQAYDAGGGAAGRSTGRRRQASKSPCMMPPGRCTWWKGPLGSAPADIVGLSEDGDSRGW